MTAYGGIIFIKHQITNELTKFKSLKNSQRLSSILLTFRSFFQNFQAYNQVFKQDEIKMAAYVGIVFIKHRITIELTKSILLKKFIMIAKYFYNIQNFFLKNFSRTFKHIIKCFNMTSSTWQLTAVERQIITKLTKIKISKNSQRLSSTSATFVIFFSEFFNDIQARN